MNYIKHIIGIIQYNFYYKWLKDNCQKCNEAKGGVRGNYYVIIAQVI